MIQLETKFKYIYFVSGKFRKHFGYINYSSINTHRSKKSNKL